MNISIVAIAITSFALTGCVVSLTRVTPLPTKVSEDAGTVIMTYIEYNTVLNGPIVPDWKNGKRLAARECSIMGYTNAKVSKEDPLKQCDRWQVAPFTNQLICVQASINTTYQCVD